MNKDLKQSLNRIITKYDSVVDKKLEEYDATVNNRFTEYVKKDIDMPTDMIDDWVKMGDSNSPLKSIAYGNGIIVAVGEEGTIQYSTDEGATWSTTSSGTTATLNCVIYVNDYKVFITANEDGTIYSSSDGITWTGVHSTNGFPIRSIAYGNGIILASTYTYDGTFYFPVSAISKDGGTTWEQYELSLIMDNADAGCVVFIDGWNVFIIASNGQYMSTIDGEHTDRRSVIKSIYRTGAQVTAMMYRHGTLVAVTDSALRMYVNNFDDMYNLSWEIAGTDGTVRHDVTYGDNKFITIGDQSTVYSSEDGISWTAHVGTTDSVINLYGIEYVDGTFIAVGTDGMYYAKFKTTTNDLVDTLIELNELLSCKVDNNNILDSVGDCVASTNPNDIAGANALAELDGKLAWKEYGVVSGSNGSSISTNFDFNEIKIATVLSNGAVFTKTISKEEITEANGANRWYYDGFYQSSSGTGAVAWIVTNVKVQLSWAWFNGIQYSDNSAVKTYLYYR